MSVVCEGYVGAPRNASTKNWNCLMHGQGWSAQYIHTLRYKLIFTFPGSIWQLNWTLVSNKAFSCKKRKCSIVITGVQCWWRTPFYSFLCHKVPVCCLSCKIKPNPSHMFTNCLFLTFWMYTGSTKFWCVDMLSWYIGSGSQWDLCTKFRKSYVTLNLEKIKIRAEASLASEITKN